jgi:hypothetical protein
VLWPAAEVSRRNPRPAIPTPTVKTRATFINLNFSQCAARELT